MTRPVLVLGYSPLLVKEFGRFLPDGGLMHLEEPEPARRRDVRSVVAETPVCGELVEHEYLRPGGADEFYLAHPGLDPVAVLPAHDYAVPVAARLAERYGVPGAGVGAAAVLRDKHLLRVVAAAAGLPNPVSRPVSSAADVAAVRAEVGGPVVIKPANRQASIGTAVVTHPRDIGEAWERCLEQESEACLPDRAPELRMLAEEFVDGDEYSVEMLYGGGRRHFANVTAKVLFPGPRPIEQGHLVPAPIDDDLAELLAVRTEELLAAVGFGTGLVHCEWIVRRGVPHLVECAGRQPGDFILELIRGAYDFDVFRAYVDLMAGRRPAAATGRPSGAVTWHDTAAPGEVVSVDGLPEARALPGIDRCSVTVEVGSTVHALRSSWDRPVVVTAYAATTAEALDRARRAVAAIRVETRPEPAERGSGTDDRFHTEMSSV